MFFEYNYVTINFSNYVSYPKQNKEPKSLLSGYDTFQPNNSFIRVDNNPQGHIKPEICLPCLQKVILTSRPIALSYELMSRYPEAIIMVKNGQIHNTYAAINTSQLEELIVETPINKYIEDLVKANVDYTHQRLVGFDYSSESREALTNQINQYIKATLKALKATPISLIKETITHDMVVSCFKASNKEYENSTNPFEGLPIDNRDAILVISTNIVKSINEDTFAKLKPIEDTFDISSK